MKKKIAIVGGGASALILGCILNTEKFDVTIFEKNAALGRKFLVAGDGGLNLTYSENPKEFILKYTPFEFLIPAFTSFSNTQFISWINHLGIETFIGSSGRVFPKKGIKPIQVLNAIEKRILNNHVRLKFKHEWKGFTTENELLFETPTGTKQLKSDFIIFCLGGASWPVTGSRGDWAKFFLEKNVCVNSFQPSNCSFRIDWPKEIIKKIEGKPIKNCSITCNEKKYFGEVVLTSNGIEGSGIYPLSPEIRKNMFEFGSATISIDFKPGLTTSEMLGKILKTDQKISYTENIAKKLNLNATQLTLLKSKMSKNDFLDPIKVVNNLKNFEIKIYALGLIEDAISTVGGIALNEITKHFELKKIKNNFVIGEMLDYDAPTGGYLLQSCFSMGHYLANYLNKL